MFLPQQRLNVMEVRNMANIIGKSTIFRLTTHFINTTLLIYMLTVNPLNVDVNVR